MPDQKVLSTAANAELDQLIAIIMHLLGASSAYDLKPRNQTGSTTCPGNTRRAIMVLKNRSNDSRENCI